MVKLVMFDYDAGEEPNKTERIANRNKTVVLLVSIVFPPLGYWLLGKRKYGLLCLFTGFYFVLGFLIVPIHTRRLVSRARSVVNGEVEQKSHHRQYGACPSCGEQMLRVCGPRTVVCESCGERHRYDDVERLGLLQSLTTSDNDGTSPTEGFLPSTTDLDDGQTSATGEAPSNAVELDDSDITERVERIEGESNPAFGIATGLSLIGFGALISITGIGAIIGVPMVAVGLLIVIVGLVGQTGKTAKKTMTESVWKGTELEEGGARVTWHRKVNKKFGGRCVVCGEFAALRDESGKGVSDEVQCKECGARLEKEEAEGWRLVEGDDERVGERKEIAQWKDELRERELKQSNRE